MGAGVAWDSYLPTCCPAALAFTSYKSESKLRFIINLRLYNSCFPKPPSFLLPHLDDLLTLPEFGQLWFVKFDLQNCFWSLQLPDDVHGAFYGCLFNTTFFGQRERVGNVTEVSYPTGNFVWRGRECSMEW